ncbi:MAG: MinD/ParA family ATP-binding protein [Candidatus Kariarchaeaceae archaeon]|jgi:MinD-like ATPase involved in chromosome partitioning or flagellar assembly
MVTVCAIHSYKGGTGKSIVTVNLAVILAKMGKSVVVLDTDFGAPSLYTFFPTSFSQNKTTLNDVILRDANFNDALIDVSPLIEGTGTLFIGLADHHSDQTRQMIRRGTKETSEDARKLFNWIEILKQEPISAEYILLDTAPGLSFLSVNSISVCDVAILLLRLLNADLLGTREMIEGLHSKLVTHIMLVVNQLPPEFLEGENADSINELVQTHIIDRLDRRKTSSGGVIVKDLDVVRLEAQNMLELLRTGKEVRDLHVNRYPNSPFSKSINNVAKLLSEGNGSAN